MLEHGEYRFFLIPLLLFINLCFLYYIMLSISCNPFNHLSFISFPTEYRVSGVVNRNRLHIYVFIRRLFRIERSDYLFFRKIVPVVKWNELPFLTVVINMLILSQ